MKVQAASPKHPQSLFKTRHAAQVHFVGIGGIGMSGIAEVLINLGYRVSGSDLKESDLTRRLAALGAKIDYGHRAENLVLADVVVISSAVRKENPEVVAARARKIPVIPRAEMLAELMRLKYAVAVAGSHGKTTTTSMVAMVLAAAGLDPTAVVGGKVNVLDSNAKLGKSELMVVEADESDGSFLKLHPSIAVVTNIDSEHMDYYGRLESLQEAFVEFCNRVPFYGLNVLCLDHPNVQALLPEIEKRYVTYGRAHTADYRLENVRLEGFSTRFDAFRRDESLGEFAVRMVGAHNALNALAVIAVAEEMDVPLDTVRTALAEFGGVQRRFTVRGEVRGITVVDDYGHHPVEVLATLAGARRAFGRRVVVAFQPHRYSRTRDLLGEFATSFNDADVVFLTSIYAAGEEPLPGVTGKAVADAIAAYGHRDVNWVERRADLAAAIVPRLKEGDLVITLGAGDITQVGPELLSMLRGGGMSVAALKKQGLAGRLGRHLEGDVRADEPLAPKTSIRVGGAAELFVRPQTADGLVRLLALARREQVPVHLLGGGANTLVGDGGVAGMVVKLPADFFPEEVEASGTSGVVTLGAGASISRLIHHMKSRGWTGAEFLAGIPGTIGGALSMNAGTKMGECLSAVVAVELATAEGLGWIPRAQLPAAYRHTELPAGGVVTRVRFVLRAGDAQASRSAMDADLAYRKRTQPLSLPNFGSAFKNPPGDHAGRLIEKVGLKGHTVGGAQISTLHANWIVNLGEATARDVVALLELAQKRVREETGVELVPEVKRVGSFE